MDMTATISRDLTGADAVARAYQRAVVSRMDLRLVVTSGVVLRMLGMTGVGRLVPVYPSVEAALAARSPQPRAPRPRRRTRARPEATGEGTMTGASQGGGVRTDVGVEIALLDRDGVIAWVNQAWRAFAAANGGDPARTGSGVSYLQGPSRCRGRPGGAVKSPHAIRAALAGADLPGARRRSRCPVTAQPPNAGSTC